MTQGHRRPTIAAMLMAAAAAVGCSNNPREDVRLALCKDMVRVELGSTPTWQGSRVQLHGHEDAVVTVRFATAAGDQQAACHYKHAGLDDTALTLANPIEAYATSPSKMVLNGRTLTGANLAQLVMRAMQRQGREFVDRARETLKGQ
ncbi:hypothetical protein [uncultured Thiodictyon sp.]|uniref:hypothetical protein n=1 Tax=uncultured Thiodictyon sp. TaxID=1846217 RepID=UPI0025D08F70|nr:hypothetical protein [uncultured Thiodictyon sp.]